MFNYDDGQDCYPEPEVCHKCEEHEEKMLHGQEYLEKILAQLYGKGAIDLIELENNLDELCHFFKIKPTPGDLNIDRRKARILTAHKQFITFMKE